MTERKLEKEKKLVHSLLKSKSHENQLQLLKCAKRDNLDTVVKLANRCYRTPEKLKKFTPKDQKYLKCKQQDVILVLDNVKTSHLNKEKMLNILTKISAIDDGKIMRTLLKSYVVKE